MKPINPKIHGVLDYLFAAFLFLAPSLLDFHGETAATLFYILGAAHLGLSLMTAYPMGMFRYIPFTTHATIELMAAIFLVAAPWLFGFADYLEAARNAYVISGIGVIGLWSLTNYRSAIRRDTGTVETFQHERKGSRAA